MKMYYEAPNGHPDYTDRAAVFLAGGITDCPDWQREVADSLEEAIIMNPRRADFPIDDPNASQEQIHWEYRGLRRADVILFWFPAGAIQPIALFELGRWSSKNTTLIVGRDNDYERKQDIDIQMKLSFIPVYQSLDKVIEMTQKSVDNFNALR